MKIIVHPRIHKRHPNITQNNVLEAFESLFMWGSRFDGRGIGLGVDSNGRVLELVWREKDDGIFIIYHALTPPTKKFLQEIYRR